jgi:hypothetical protein
MSSKECSEQGGAGEQGVSCGKKEELWLTGRDFERRKDMVKREENANRGKCVKQ